MNFSKHIKPSHQAAEGPLLSRAECQMMRGLAIIGIFLHNYCHWLKGVVRENEYQFFERNVDGLVRAVVHADGYLPLHLVSFFGHYGVPVFLFLSAYGLEMKYGQASSQGTAAPTKGVWRFMRVHWLKLFKMMIVGLVAFLMVDYVTPGPHHYQVVDLLGQLTLTNNLLPHPDRVIWPGPYWFFGLMAQLYLVWIAVLHRRSWCVTAALMAACTAAQLLFGPESEALNRYRYNFMGGMLPFGMGVLYARFGAAWLRQWSVMSAQRATICALAVVAAMVMSGSFVMWMLVPAAVVVATVTLVKAMSRVSWLATVNGMLAWMGAISAALFVCHPITRKLFIPISRWGDVYAGLLIYVVTSICVAWLFRELLRKVPSPRA